MEQAIRRIEELKSYVLEQLEGTSLTELYTEGQIEEFYEAWDGLDVNLYRLAQRITDELIVRQNNHLHHAAV